LFCADVLHLIGIVWLRLGVVLGSQRRQALDQQPQ
jgi:hypothetical protein